MNAIVVVIILRVQRLLNYAWQRCLGAASSRGSNNTFIMLQLKLAADSRYHFEQGLVYFNNVKTFHRVFFLQTTK